MAAGLYHFSEDSGIELFVPHRAPTSLVPEQLVWALDAWHAPMYYFPRQCPRACFWPTDETTDADRRRWFSYVPARMVIAIEASWLDRLRATTLYRYTLPAGGFQLHDATAGHWVAREPVGDLLTALRRAGVELRITPRLMPLWQEVIASTLAFSGTRLRNALDYNSLRLPEQHRSAEEPAALPAASSQDSSPA